MTIILSKLSKIPRNCNKFLPWFPKIVLVYNIFIYFHMCYFSIEILKLLILSLLICSHLYLNINKYARTFFLSCAAHMSSSPSTTKAYFVLLFMCGAQTISCTMSVVQHLFKTINWQINYAQLPLGRRLHAKRRRSAHCSIK